jgi:LuxR family maltose regulon positive regulatory protein
VEEAQRLLAASEDRDAGVGDDLRALALVSLGVAERFSFLLEEARRHLSQGVALARSARRAYLEVDGLAVGAMVEAISSYPRGTELATQAVELGERHGWENEPVAAPAYVKALWQGQLDPAEPWLERGGRAMRAEIQPGDALSLHLRPAGVGPRPGRQRRRPLSDPPSGSRSWSPSITWSPPSCGRRCCTPLCAWARPSAPRNAGG